MNVEYNLFPMTGCICHTVVSHKTHRGVRGEGNWGRWEHSQRVTDTMAPRRQVACRVKKERWEGERAASSCGPQLPGSGVG